jgi:hypothetical protein
MGRAATGEAYHNCSWGVVINRVVGQTLTIQAHPEDGRSVPPRNNAFWNCISVDDFT